MVSLVDQLMSRMALPVLGAPMFIVSTPELVIAQCTSGVIGACVEGHLGGRTVGNIRDLPSTQALVPRLREEYAAARAKLLAPERVKVAT